MCPSVESIYSVLRQSPSSVLHIYVVGSHLWQTCSKSSDWDFVVVTSSEESSKQFSNLHKGNTDILKISVDEYKKRLQEHSMQVLLTVYLPGQFVLKSSFHPRTLFSYSKLKLLESLSTTKERDFRVAEKHFTKGNIGQAKKIIMHFVRYLDLGIQMKDTSSYASMNFSSASIFQGEILNNPHKTWEQFFTSLQPIIDSLWSELVR